MLYNSMSTNTVKMELAKRTKVEEKMIDEIMDYHGDTDKTLPEGKSPETKKSA